METKTLSQKLLDFQKTINVIKKDGKNPHFKSTYATLQQILSEVKPLLSELGLVLLQPIKGNKAITIIQDSTSKDFVDADIELPSGLNAQQMGSAITYYRRYLLAGLLSLELDDDDANHASTTQTNGSAAKPYLNENSSQFADAIKFLQDGGTIESIEKKYSISKTVRENLLSQAI